MSFIVKHISKKQPARHTNTKTLTQSHSHTHANTTKRHDQKRKTARPTRIHSHTPSAQKYE